MATLIGTFRDRSRKRWKYSRRKIAIPRGMAKRILEKYDYACVYCNGPAVDVDHIQAWQFNQVHDENNLVAACKLCNALGHMKAFENLSDKREYILERRKRKRGKTVIALWFVEDFESLGPGLKRMLGDGIALCDSVEDLFEKAVFFAQEGFKVVGPRIPHTKIEASQIG